MKNNEQFELAAFRERYEEIVYAGNTVLFVVGNFEPPTAKALITRYFGDGILQ